MMRICNSDGCKKEASESSTYGYCADHMYFNRDIKGGNGCKGGDGSKRETEWQGQSRGGYGVTVGRSRRGNNTFGSG